MFSIFGSLYHINSETDMHILLIFDRMYHINSQFLFTLLLLVGYLLICFILQALININLQHFLRGMLDVNDFLELSDNY
jgi:hypothetical protein